MRPLRAALAALCGLSLSSCGSPSIPTGLSCSAVNSVGDAAALSAALARAAAGSCVFAKAGSYRGNFDVPAQVSLVGDSSGATVLQGEVDTAPAVRLHAASGLYRTQVVAPPGSKGLGVSIVGSAAHVEDVEVSGAKSVGIYGLCTEDCGRPDAVSFLDRVNVHGNSIGVWINGAPFTLRQGRVAEQVPASLTSGLGVIASAGAALVLEGTAVEKNGFIGLLLDGAGGTSARLTEAQVLDNSDRGVWAQGLTGTAAAPKLVVERCTVERNLIAGIGVRASTGVQISGGRIAATALASDGGDGLGLFEGSGEVLVDGVTLSANQRSQILVDKGGAGILVQGSTLETPGGEQGIVVQRTVGGNYSGQSGTVPTAGQELPVRTDPVALPTN